MVLMLVLALTLGRVEGMVTLDDMPLPGCKVTLGSTVVTNVDGRYRFDNVPTGKHVLTFALEGLETVTTTIEVRGDTTVPPTALKLPAIEETVTIACGFGAVCSGEAPQTRYDVPLCADSDFDASLAEAIGRGDSSALALARKRYDTAFTYAQKHELARMLLGNVSNDSAIWNELYEHAVIAVRYPRSPKNEELTPEYLQWAAERGLPPERYDEVARGALWQLAREPRSRTLLHQALATDDENLITAAICGFAVQKDGSALPAIEATLQRLPNRARHLVWPLADYESSEADALAFKYLDETRRESYVRSRAETRP